jgi:hypothetical protein
MLEADLFADVDVVVDLERKGLGLAEDLDGVGHHLDGARRQGRVLVTGRARRDRPGDPDAVLGAKVVRNFFVADHYLGDARGVAQVDEGGLAERGLLEEAQARLMRGDFIYPFGLKGIDISSASDAHGSVLSSSTRNVRLDRGTRMLLVNGSASGSAGAGLSKGASDATATASGSAGGAAKVTQEPAPEAAPAQEPVRNTDRR